MAEKIKVFGAKKVFFVGSGGAYTKFVNMRPLILETLKTPFIITSPEELISLYSDIASFDSLIIFGSKTGETIELIEALNTLNLDNSKVKLIGFIGDHNTTIDKEFDFERINSVDTDVHLIALGWLLIMLNEKISNEEKSKVKKELMLSSQKISKVLAKQKLDLQQQINNSNIEENQIWVGSGHLWGEVCCYTNYILEEIQWFFAQPIHSSEFFHGPFELVDESFVPNLVLNTDKNREQDLRVKKFIDKFNKDYILIDMMDYAIAYENDRVKKIIEPYMLNQIFDIMLNIYTEITGRSVKTRRYYRKFEY